MSDDAFFAVPSGGDMMYDSEDNAPLPILLGAPDPMDTPYEAVSYLGDVDEAGAPPDATDAPILLGAPGFGVDDDDDDDDPQQQDLVAVTTSSEPSPMQKWNEAWQATLILRKDEENALKAEQIEQARLALEAFTVEREQKRESKMAANRSDEQAKLEDIEADLENDNSWQRVCKMIELSHDNKTAAEDVKRMRDVMILLKNEPARATALTN
jgi:hypothetical protein